MKKYLIFILGINFCFSNAQNLEPQVISTAGENYFTESMNLSWTIGEGIITTMDNEDILLSQGFHQLFDNNQTDENNFTSSFKYFPNPALKVLNIEVELKGNNERYYVNIVSSEGKQIILKQYNTTKNEIDISELSAGLYMIIIRNNSGKIINSGKLQKIY